MSPLSAALLAHDIINHFSQEEDFINIKQHKEHSALVNAKRQIKGLKEYGKTWELWIMGKSW